MNITIHRTRTAAMVGIALCAVTVPALALPPPPYVGFDLGRTSIGLDTAAIEDAGLQSTGSDRRDSGYAITLGWRFSPYLAAEAAFTDLGEGKYTVAVDDGGAVSNATVRMQSTGVLLALAGTWPLNERVALEGRAGAYLGKNETRVRGVMTGPLGSQDFNNLLGSESKAGLAAGVGAVFALNDTWGLRAGYDYIDKAFGKDARRISVGVRFNWP